MNNDKVYQMSFSKIYPLLVNKALKKDGRKKKWMKSSAGSQDTVMTKSMR